VESVRADWTSKIVSNSYTLHFPEGTTEHATFTASWYRPHFLLANVTTKKREWRGN
jgi:hypothetical protein